MKIDNLKDAAAGAASKAAIHAKKHSPTILFVGGTVGVVTAAVMASRATLKLEDVLAETEAKSKEVIEFEHEEYSVQDRNRDLMIVRLRAIKNVARLYGPAIIVGGLSIAALTGSHMILKDRNSALMAAYAALDAGYKKYRARVVDELGPEKDLEFRHGAETRTEVVVGDDGEAKEIEHKVAEPGMPSIYARFFDEFSHNWSKNNEDCLIFLNSQQNYWNNRLHVHGYVYLNEVYEALGLERTQAGQVVGWVLNGEGDNFIDFGLYDETRERARAFVNGREGAILLDFNVDGVILDLV